MNFWIIVGVLCLLAIAFAAWPLWREARRLTPLVATIVVFTVALSAAVYDRVGSPGVPSGRAASGSGDHELEGMDEAIESLEKRLANNPDDVSGWKMLARTQMAMRNFSAAATAYEKAMAIEGAQVAQTLVDLALAIANRDQAPISGRSAALVENALALEPNNQPALFYSGIAAANRNDFATAANLWEKLLGLNPPDNVRATLEQNIAMWRGEEPSAQPADAAQPAAEPQEVPEDAVVAARVSLSDEAMAAMTRDVNVFIIARDPAAPVPPIAVSRRRLSELPAVVSLSDAESMVAGRNLSGFAEIELLARVSMSGGPAAQSGDWFGSMIVRPAENNSVQLTIDQQVP